MRIVKLQDAPLSFFIDRDKHKETPFGEALITAGYEALCARGLCYNVAAGIARDKAGWLSRFTSSADIPVDYTDDDVFEYALQPFVRNSASRLSRGFSA